MSVQTATVTIKVYDERKPGALRAHPTNIGDADCGSDGKFDLGISFESLIVSKPGSPMFAEVDLKPLIEKMIDHLIVRIEAS